MSVHGDHPLGLGQPQPAAGSPRLFPEEALQPGALADQDQPQVAVRAQGDQAALDQRLGSAVAAHGIHRQCRSLSAQTSRVRTVLA